MEVYLPIVGIQINVLLILFVSYVIGFLSGLFGVGGGFLMTPFLIFMGIPPAYAIANEANNILASSSSGTLTHWFKKTMDLKMGWMIIAGGLVGTAFGMITFGYFKGINKIDIVITLAYMYVLAIVGSFMLRDGIMEIDRIKKKVTIKKKLHTHYWIHGLPFRNRFKTSYDKPLQEAVYDFNQWQNGSPLQTSRIKNIYDFMSPENLVNEYKDGKTLDPNRHYHLEDCNGKVNPVFKGNFDIEKNKLSTFISKEFSLKNISDAVGSIIGEHK